MKKRIFMLFIFSLLGNLCFSQTKIAEVGIPPNSTKGNVSVSVNAVDASSSNPTAPIFEKIPLPKGQKNSPAVFYIVNDSAVSYKVYMHNKK